MASTTKSKAAEHSYPSDESPTYTISSKISSPSKRTLNNKNYLSSASYDEFNTGLEGKASNRSGAPIPTPLFLNTHQKLKINGNMQLPQLNSDPFSNEVSKSNNIYAGNKRIRPRFNGSLQHPSSDARNSGAHRGSTTRAQKSNNGKPRGIKYREVYDASEIITNSSSLEKDSFENRYFSQPVDLDEIRTANGKLRPIINTISGNSNNNSNLRVYKLAVSLLASQRTYQVMKNEIASVYRPQYFESQPLCLFGDKTANFSTLDEMNKKIRDYLQKPMKSQPTIQSGRPLIAASTINDSFELSFDGKALDRSDIFRMVDSFSVAFSDEDDEDESSLIASPSNNVLPSEMTSSVF